MAAPAHPPQPPRSSDDCVPAAARHPASPVRCAPTKMPLSPIAGSIARAASPVPVEISSTLLPGPIAAAAITWGTKSRDQYPVKRSYAATSTTLPAAACSPGANSGMASPKRIDCGNTVPYCRVCHLWATGTVICATKVRKPNGVAFGRCRHLVPLHRSFDRLHEGASEVAVIRRGMPCALQPLPTPIGRRWSPQAVSKAAILAPVKTGALARGSKICDSIGCAIGHKALV
jgi:hypothetical protein